MLKDKVSKGGESLSWLGKTQELEHYSVISW